MTTELSLDTEGCRVLLVEIIRRAAFDWVTYRDSTRLNKKSIAHDAYIWLFVEGPGHPDWKERDGLYIFSFLGICEVLGLEPDYMRGCIRKLTFQHIQNIGRPKTQRRLPRESVGQDASGHDYLLDEEKCISDLEEDFPEMPYLGYF